MNADMEKFYHGNVVPMASALAVVAVFELTLKRWESGRMLY